MRPQQGDPNLLVQRNQVTTAMPTHIVSPPHPNLQLVPQAEPLPLQPLQTQQSLEAASQDMVTADTELDGWRTDTDSDIPNLVPDSPMHTDYASPIRGGNDVWFGVGENNTNHTHTDYTFGGANPIGSFASLNLGGGELGAMNGVMMEAANSPTADSREQGCFNEHMF